MLPSILETIQAQQVWIADHNFCTREGATPESNSGACVARQFLAGIA